MSKPRRPSLKYLPELIEYEGNSVLEKTLQRRVSFANVISICGATEGITQLPLSKCSEDSTECTKSNAFVLPDISSTCDVSMNICSDTSLQNSPQFCKPSAVSIPTDDSLKPTYSNCLSTTMDVSMSYTSSVVPVSSKKLQPSIAILGGETVETSDVSMVIDDECSFGGNHPVWKASRSFPVVSTYHNVSPVSTTIDMPGSPMFGITEHFAEDSPPKIRDVVGLPVEDEVMPDQSDLVPTSCPNNAPSTPPAPQIPSQVTVGTPKTQKTPMLEIVPSSYHLASVPSHVFSIPPLKSDQCLWNSVPGRPRKKRALLTQSATRWHYRLQRRAYIPDEGDDEVDQPKANADHQLTGSHSISLNNTPIRRIGPRLDWFEAAKEHNLDMSTSLLKVRRHKTACLRSESAALARDLMKLNRLPFPGIITTAFNTQISPLLNLKNLPLPTVADELRDLYGVPPVFSELDRVLEKSEIKKMKIDRATWWVRSCNLRSRADSLTGSDSLLLYGKLCLDRQKAVLETCQAAKLDDELDVTHCYGAAMETLKRCTSETAQELMQLKKDRFATRQSHLHDQVDFLRQLDAQLAGECEQLQQELTLVNFEISEWEQFTVDDNKENVAAVISGLDNQLTGVTDQLNQVDLQLKVMKSTPSGTRSKQHRQNLAFGSVGCTELYAPPRSLIADKNEVTGSSNNVMVELVNLLSPSRLECLDLAMHKYQLTCLLGHVAVVSTCCCLCPSGDEQSPPLVTSTSAVWPEELLVESVSLSSPDRVTSTSDCPAVDQLARFTIDFLGSESNSSASPSSLSPSCFRSRLVGMSLAEASDYVDFVLLPYLLLACDLRSIYLRGHSVEFSVLKHGTETASTCLPSTSRSGGDGQTLPVTRDGALSSFLLATPALKCLSDLANSCPALDELVPPWPVRVTVNLEHSATRSVLLVKFTLDRLDYHRPVACSTSVQVLVGQVNADKIQVLLDEQEIRLGQLHQIVSLLEETLSSTRCS